MLAKRIIPALILEHGLVMESHKYVLTNCIHDKVRIAIEQYGVIYPDEVLVIDASRTTEHRQKFYDALVWLSENTATPITAGGWITSIAEAKRLFDAGADKIVICTACHTDSYLVSRIAERYGCQAVVAAVDYKGDSTTSGTVWVNRGRFDTQEAVLPYILERVRVQGWGEILLTSIDHEGEGDGYDLDTLRQVVQTVNVPVIANGGVGRWEHLAEGLDCEASGVAMANWPHYSQNSIGWAKKQLKKRGYNVR